MTTSTLQVEVKLPKAGEEEFERLVEDLAEAVYRRVNERLEQDAEGAKVDISGA
ncbi:hypothetical protein LU689_12365 [Pseudomonas asiatica]|uniref:hypothetical protein n=1 Tax=Pseudomonas asiatica TaxID=2219225 RepID=UPI001E426F58|nr:hypothetical protein [Pseudomonas asiatica]MCE0850705.1 hypothetical protein [Pseudomonas asiatica]